MTKTTKEIAFLNYKSNGMNEQVWFSQSDLKQLGQEIIDYINSLPYESETERTHDEYTLMCISNKVCSILAKYIKED